MATNEYNILPLLHPYEEMDVTTRTSTGIGILARKPDWRVVLRRATRLALERGPFLAAFDAGMWDVVDLTRDSVDVTVLAFRRGGDL